MPPTGPPLPDPDAELGIVDALAQLTFLVQGELGRIAAAHDLSLTQLRLLGILRDREVGMMALAAHLGLDKSSVSGLIDRAERRGLVRRDRDPADRRAFLVTVTDEGQELIGRVQGEADARIEALTAALTPRQRDQLAKLAGVVVAGS